MSENVISNIKHKKNLKSAKTQSLIFYISMMALPIAVCILFYIYVSVQSFALAFQGYDFEKGFFFNGFENFELIIKEFTEGEELLYSLKNSAELFLWTFVFSALLAILFSYYIYKKHIFSGLFKLILYMPHIVSGVVFAIMFKFFVDVAVPDVWKGLTGDTIRPLIGLGVFASSKPTVLIYSIWASFGVSVLMYTSAMGSISPSIIESAELDGIKPMQELVYLVIPSIWETFVTFMLAAILGFFTNQMSLYTIFALQAPPQLYTFGYYLYAKVVQAEYMDYSYLSALGLLLTAVAVPITLTSRYLMIKFGPKSE